MNIDSKEKSNKYLSAQILAVLFLYNEEIELEKIKEFIGEYKISNIDIENNILELEVQLRPLGLIILKNKIKDNKIYYKLVLDNNFSDIARKIRKEELEGSLTPASLQVLTICAYLGSADKNEISFIRGVQSTQSIRSLMVRGLIKKVGNKYVISIDALQKLGLKQIEDLPEYQSIKEDFKERLKDLISQENVSFDE